MLPSLALGHAGDMLDSLDVKPPTPTDPSSLVESTIGLLWACPKQPDRRLDEAAWVGWCGRLYVQAVQHIASVSESERREHEKQGHRRGLSHAIMVTPRVTHSVSIVRRSAV